MPTWQRRTVIQGHATFARCRSREDFKMRVIINLNVLSRADMKTKTTI